MIAPFMNPRRVPLHAQIHSHYRRRDDCCGAAQALAEHARGIQSAVRRGADQRRSPRRLDAFIFTGSQ